jgi:tetratricopeptide (TPR) repeat protein
MTRTLNIIYRSLVILAATLLVSPVVLAQRDPIRQDVLTFSGVQPVAANTLTNDSYVVTLRSRTPVPQQYFVVLRSVDPVERALFQDAADGRWDEFDLFRAALVAEGIRDPEKIRQYEDKLNGIAARVKSRLQNENKLTPQALTKALFEAMHRDLLTKDYLLDCTEISKVMATGHYNCVSATVLFNCLADKAGLDVSALEMPGHALSRVRFDGASMNLETTCPTWFSLRNNEERLNASMSRVAPQTAEMNPATGNAAGVALPIENLEDFAKGLREITPVQLVATIYYNIGVDKHVQKQFAEVAAANVKALYLDPANQTAWGNLLAAINNLSIDLTSVKDEERFDLAAILLDQGLTLDPAYKNFTTNQRYVFYHWIYGLAIKRRFDDARTVFKFADARLPGDEKLAALMSSIDKEAAKEQ